jgi:putative Mg2+ transporter-C (MgtC) family protein
MAQFALQDMLARLLLALACGAVIGLNRDLHGKSVGFRTFGLVSAGSAIVALVITQVSTDVNAVSRVIQGVLTDIGFLGAGVILHQPTSSRVTGLTTAAAVWLTAGLGLACGLGALPADRDSSRKNPAREARQATRNAADPDDLDG